MNDGRNDFQFIAGCWTVQHRRLVRRLAGCTDWQTFGGTSRAWPLLDGLGCVDDNLLRLPAGDYRAASLRAFNPATGQWSIWWLDGRSPDRIDVPVVGSFDNGVGSFYADEVIEGRPVHVRFRWTRTDTPSPRWEQAFSPDGGATWETNWEMDFESDVSRQP